MIENKYSPVLFLLLIFLVRLPLPAENVDDKFEREWIEQEVAYARYIVYVNEIINSFAEQMEKELNLQCTGEGGIMHKEVKEIFLKFQVYRRASIEEARALELYVTNKLLEKINSHENIQQFLIERPFTHKHVSILIRFEGVNGTYSDGSVAFMLSVTDSAVPENQNTIVYSSNDPFRDQYNDILREPYDEAAQKAADSALVFPFTHKTTDLEAALDASLLPFTKLIMFDRDIHCKAMGGKVNDGSIEEIGGSLRVLHRVSQEEARKLVIFATEKLLEHINRNDKLKPFLKQHPLPIDRLKLCIYFTDKNYRPDHDGSIISVVLEAGELSYYHRVRIPDEGDKKFWISEKTLFAKETYQKALENIQESQSISVFSKIHRAIGRWFGYKQ